MIGKLELNDFPLTQEQCDSALQALAKQIHSRYRSPFTLVLVLPQSLLLGKKLESLLLEDGAMPLIAGIGVLPTRDESGNPTIVAIEPPSLHLIKNKRVVVFDAWGMWQITLRVCSLLSQMRPSSVEVGSFVAHGPVPEWANTDYVGFEVPEGIVVSGLGLGYTQEQASGGVLVAQALRDKEDSSDERGGS